MLLLLPLPLPLLLLPSVVVFASSRSYVLSVFVFVFGFGAISVRGFVVRLGQRLYLRHCLLIYCRRCHLLRPSFSVLVSIVVPTVVFVWAVSRSSHSDNSSIVLWSSFRSLRSLFDCCSVIPVVPSPLLDSALPLFLRSSMLIPIVVSLLSLVVVHLSSSLSRRLSILQPPPSLFVIILVAAIVSSLFDYWLVPIFGSVRHPNRRLSHFGQFQWQSLWLFVVVAYPSPIGVPK